MSRDQTRRAFFAAAAAPAALAAPAQVRAKERLVMATSWGRGQAGVFDAAQYCADAIAEMSDGALSVEVFAAGERFGAFDVFDKVANGEADLGHSADYYYLDRHPGFAFYTTVPFGMTAEEFGDWYGPRGGGVLHNELGERFGLKIFPAGATGAQPGGWFTRPMRSVEDFNGLRFRMPGLGGEVLERLGAEIAQIPGLEVYQQLSSGLLDGTEWIGPWTDEKAGFSEIAKYYYVAGFHEPGTSLSLFANRGRFDEMSPAHRRIIETAAAAANQWSLHLFNAKNAAALKRIEASGVNMMTFSDPIWEAFGVAAKDVLGRYGDDDLFSRINESYQASLRDSALWLSRSSGEFSQRRRLVLGLP